MEVLVENHENHLQPLNKVVHFKAQVGRLPPIVSGVLSNFLEQTSRILASCDLQRIVQLVDASHDKVKVKWGRACVACLLKWGAKLEHPLPDLLEFIGVEDDGFSSALQPAVTEGEGEEAVSKVAKAVLKNLALCVHVVRYSRAETKNHLVFADFPALVEVCGIYDEYLVGLGTLNP